MNIKNKKEPVETSPLNSKSNISQLDDYRNNRKIEISHRGFVFIGFETTEEEARKDWHGWLINIAIKALSGDAIINKPLRFIEIRRAG